MTMQDAAVQAKMIRLRVASVAAVCVVLLSRLEALGADPVDFNRQIKPLLESACVGCHWPQKVKGGLRLTGALPYFEAIPTVRYVRVFDDGDVGFGVQLLGCPGYGICLTGGYEYLKDSKDQRYFGGVRFYYD